MSRIVLFLCGMGTLLVACHAQAPPPPLRLPSSLTCYGDELPMPAVKLPRRHRPSDPADPPPPTQGVPTEEGIMARRLFEAGKWNEAVPALSRVENGDSGDDAGNRQLAAYHRAVALYNLHRDAEAAEAFARIAVERSHVRHEATLLYVARLAPSHPELVATLGAYDDDVVEKFNNPNQIETYWVLAYLFGRDRWEGAGLEVARGFFSKVGEASEYRPYAEKCLARIAPAFKRSQTEPKSP